MKITGRMLKHSLKLINLKISNVMNTVCIKFWTEKASFYFYISTHFENFINLPTITLKFCTRGNRGDIARMRFMH